MPDTAAGAETPGDSSITPGDTEAEAPAELAEAAAAALAALVEMVDLAWATG